MSQANNFYILGKKLTNANALFPIKLDTFTTKANYISNTNSIPFSL